MEDNKSLVQGAPCVLKKPMSQEDQWKVLMNQPDPLADGDIYANEKREEEVAVNQVSSEDMEMEDDIGGLLDRSFKTEKNKSSLVQNIPQILQKKKDDNYAKLFTGISEKDINGMEV